MGFYSGCCSGFGFLYCVVHSAESEKKTHLFKFWYWVCFLSLSSLLKYVSHFPTVKTKYHLVFHLYINPLNAKLNPICHLLALLGAHHILHVSRVRV